MPVIVMPPQTFTVTAFFVARPVSPGTVTNILPLSAFVDFSTNGGVTWQRLATFTYPDVDTELSCQYTNEIDVAIFRAGVTVMP